MISKTAANDPSAPCASLHRCRKGVRAQIMALQTMRRVKKKNTPNAFLISHGSQSDYLFLAEHRLLNPPTLKASQTPAHKINVLTFGTSPSSFFVLIWIWNRQTYPRLTQVRNSVPDSLTIGCRIYGHQGSLKVLLVKPNSQSSVNAILLWVIMCVIMPAPTIAPCLSCAKEMSV